MTGAFWTALSSAAGVIGVSIVLIRHMLYIARQQGARDERERQMASRIDKLENRIEGVAAVEKRIVQLDATVQGWDKRFEALERTVRDGFEGFDRGFRDMMQGLARTRATPAPSTRGRAKA